MSWYTSNRKSRLPGNWIDLRRKVLRRDRYRCKIGIPGCLGTATEVDHIIRGDDHSLGNLRAVCGNCHKQKTQAEATQARRRKSEARFRPEEKHPGILRK